MGNGRITPRQIPRARARDPRRPARASLRADALSDGESPHPGRVRPVLQATGVQALRGSVGEGGRVRVTFAAKRAVVGGEEAVRTQYASVRHSAGWRLKKMLCEHSTLLCGKARAGG